MTVVNCNGVLLDLKEPKVMGILNLTPDSFFDGKRHQTIDRALFQTETMLAEGMDILDIGAASSRPGAQIVSVQEEIDRLVPIFIEIRKRHPSLLISIDTSRAQVANQLLPHTVNMINDITGGSDQLLVNIAVENSIPFVIMHMQNNPSNMQDAPHYKNVSLEVFEFLKARFHALKSAGVKDIIIDPGFGFGKTIQHNYRLLKNMEVFQILPCPIMIGLSRKSMIFKPLDSSPDNALNGTTALHMIALQHGAKILRVHDVREAKECILLHQMLHTS